MTHNTNSTAPAEIHVIASGDNVARVAGYAIATILPGQQPYDATVKKGRLFKTTNIAAEIRAAIIALNALPSNITEAVVFLATKSTINTLKDLQSVPSEARRVTRKDGGEALNADLFIQLAALAGSSGVIWNTSNPKFRRPLVLSLKKIAKEQKDEALRVKTDEEDQIAADAAGFSAVYNDFVSGNGQ